MLPSSSLLVFPFIYSTPSFFSSSSLFLLYSHSFSLLSASTSVFKFLYCCIHLYSIFFTFSSFKSLTLLLPPPPSPSSILHIFSTSYSFPFIFSLFLIPLSLLFRYFLRFSYPVFHKHSSFFLLLSSLFLLVHHSLLFFLSFFIFLRSLTLPLVPFSSLLSSLHPSSLHFLFNAFIPFTLSTLLPAHLPSFPYIPFLIQFSTPFPYLLTLLPLVTPLQYFPPYLIQSPCLSFSLHFLYLLVNPSSLFPCSYSLALLPSLPSSVSPFSSSAFSSPSIFSIFSPTLPLSPPLARQVLSLFSCHPTPLKIFLALSVYDFIGCKISDWRLFCVIKSVGIFVPQYNTLMFFVSQ